ncbi:MAG: peptidylprolyl isomerase [Bacteroidales bacterium]|nr:peptidylprolyl isomerase [Bacteroidales bacterium]
MKKVLMTIAAVLLLAGAGAQTWPHNPVVMEVGGQKIAKDEFMKDFMSSVGERLAAKPGVTEAEKRQTLDEYVELYATFRAKLKDAYALGFDTMPNLIEELKTYRDELAAPYLIDSATLERILHEAYDRNHYSLRAAHILIMVSPDASPEDTLKAYKRIMGLRDRIMGGEDFFAVSSEEVHRQQPEAPTRPNEGDLGYFTAFDMVYPFENAAYALKVGEVSMPVRTRFGYHIIKLLDKVEMFGKCDLAHIWLMGQDSTMRKYEINDCYNRLVDGQDFAIVARQSDDRTTNGNGGLMPNATLNNIPPEYVDVAQHLKEGEFSKPFFTQYGWHIVKMVRRDTLPPYESMVPYYKQKMTRDQRGEESRKAFTLSSMKRYGIQDLTQTPVPQPKGKKRKKKEPVKMQASLQQLYDIVPVEATRNRWNYNDSMVTDIHPILTMPGKSYTTLDLARYISTHQRGERPLKSEYFVNMKYSDFIDSVVMVYVDSRLEKDNPELAAVVEEYRHGLMIFNYNNAMVWRKALHDTAGFADFYARESSTKRMDNPDDSVYFWKTRAKVVTVNVVDSACIAPAKAAKILKKALKKNKGSLEMKDMLTEAVGKKCTAPRPVSVAPDLVEMGHQNLLSAGQWQKGVYLSPKTKGYRVVVVEEVMPPMLKGQMEARGYYMNGFQNEVERKHNDMLSKKYNVKINYDVVKQISY